MSANHCDQDSHLFLRICLKTQTWEEDVTLLIPTKFFLNLKFTTDGQTTDNNHDCLLEFAPQECT